MAFMMRLVLLSLSVFSLALAQSDETIWGATVITNFGDRVPLLSPDNSELTALGAQQMNTIGAAFRSRYIANEVSAEANRTIRGISHDALDKLQTTAMTMYDIYVQQSSQAFLTGLYPPFSDSSSSDGNGSIANDNTLTNGTTIQAPLSGLQFPQIYTASQLDQNYAYLNASYNCPAFLRSYRSLISSDDSVSKASNSRDLFDNLSSAVSSALPNSSLEYDNAYLLYDYLSYGQLHSTNVRTTIGDGLLSQLRAVASDLVHSAHGDTSTDSGIRAINGAGLASFAASQFYANYQMNGTENKLNIATTGDESLVSLFTVLGLTDLYSSFASLPNRASAVAFELYTASSASITGDKAPYPDPADIHVRFLFRNGTAGALSSYPFLGRTKGEPDPTLQEFFDGVASRASIMTNPGTWCSACGSSAIWCAAYRYGNYNTSGVSGYGRGEHTHGMSAETGGVIGAMVTLAVIGLLMVAAMLLTGLRFTRTGKGPLGGKVGGAHGTPSATGKKSLGGAWFGKNAMHRRQSSGLGGFKGGEKLASDVDLPQGNGGGFGASVVPVEGGGHRRVESWELREGRARAEDQNGDTTPVEGREHV